MPGPNTFAFSDYREYLLAVNHSLAEGRKGHFSVSHWSRLLGYRSPQTIGMVLKGTRLPSHDLVFRISQQLKLSPSERRYFQLLVDLERSRRRKKDPTLLLQELRHFQNVSRPIYLQAETFSFIAEWYHLVIRQLIGTPGFKNDLGWIRRRLRNKVTLSQIQNAIETMLRLGMLERGPKGRLLKTAQALTTLPDVPAQAARHHHRQMLDRAKEAIEEQHVDLREFDTKSFRMDPKRMAAAKKDLRAFREQFLNEYESETGNAVYQLGVFCFAHTKDLGERDA